MRGLSNIEVSAISGGIAKEAAAIAGLLSLMSLGGYIAGEAGVVLGFVAAASLVVYDIAG